MKIDVERVTCVTHNSDELKFIVTVRNPQLVNFSKEDFVIMKYLDEAMAKISSEAIQDTLILQDVRMKVHDIKDQIFQKILSRLKNNIKLDFQPRFDHVCQEIYNWLLDKQEGCVMKWMQEFNPERMKYYFDNDVQMKNPENKNIPINDEEEEEEETTDWGRD